MSLRQSCSEALCLAEYCLGSAVCLGTRAGEEGLGAHGSHRGLGPGRIGVGLQAGLGSPGGGGPSPPCSEPFCKAGSSFCPGADCDCPDSAHAAVTTAVLAPLRPWPPADGAVA